MRATLYGLEPSHPSHAARLMLERKGIDHKMVVDPARACTRRDPRPLGFRGGTVPALKIDGRRIQGSREISRALDEIQPSRGCSPPTRERGSRSRRPSAGARTSSRTCPAAHLPLAGGEPARDADAHGAEAGVPAADAGRARSTRRSPATSPARSAPTTSGCRRRWDCCRRCSTTSRSCSPTGRSAARSRTPPTSRSPPRCGC